MKVDNQKHAKNLIKMKTFHNIKCKIYPHDKLNTSNGSIRGKELSSATPEEIKAALGKQGVIDYQRITIRRACKEIQTCTHSNFD